MFLIYICWSLNDKNYKVKDFKEKRKDKVER